MDSVKKIAFYAPIKPPDHSEASGDRKMAALLFEALESSSYSVELASRYISYSKKSDIDNLERLKKGAKQEAKKLIEKWGKDKRPDLWFSYHCYDKAPDWLGEAVCEELNIPMVTVEATKTSQGVDGEWDVWRLESQRIIKKASKHFVLSPSDWGYLKGLVPESKMIRVNPFMSTGENSKVFAKRVLKVGDPIEFITVGMMRAGAKLESYSILAESLKGLSEKKWSLKIIGDGKQRLEVEKLFSWADPDQVQFLGALDNDEVLEQMKKADALLWPGVGEAYGMVYLEAASVGTGTIAIANSGVSLAVEDNVSGKLAEEVSVSSYSKKLEEVFINPGVLSKLGRGAQEFVVKKRSLFAFQSLLEQTLSETFHPLEKPVILFYVQHLLGAGHVYRATRVAKALHNDGCRVCLAWGGNPMPSMDLEGLEVTYLDPVHVDSADFSVLLDSQKEPMSDVRKTKRKESLLRLFDEVRPDMVIIETFPFGRKQMRFELNPLLDKIKASEKKALLVSSIRDIMQENLKEKKVNEIILKVKDSFDLVMIHGDPKFVEISKTLDRTEEYVDRIRYTGIVAPHLTAPENKLEKIDVLVSVGGSGVGWKLMKVATDAVRLSKKYPSNWCIVTGPGVSDEKYKELVMAAPTGMRVIRFVPELANHLPAVEVSVSLAGYNTVAEVLRAGCSSVLIPFDDHGETEQTRRAEAMEERGLAKMLLFKDLSAQSLVEAVDNAPTRSANTMDIDLEGAANASKILINEFQSRVNI